MIGRDFLCYVISEWWRKNQVEWSITDTISTGFELVMIHT